MSQATRVIPHLGSAVRAALSLAPGPLPADQAGALSVSNRQIHEGMLAERGITFDETEFHRSTGWDYDRAYRLLLGRLPEWDGAPPRLLVGGHAIPDRALDDAPAVRMLGEIPGLGHTFSVADGENLVAFHTLAAAATMAEELGIDSTAVILADRGDLAYPTPGPGPAGNHGILLLFEGIGDPADPATQPVFRFGATDPLRLEELAADLLAEVAVAGPRPDGLVIDPELAGRWLPSPSWGDLTVGPAGYPATSLFQAALRWPAGTMLVLMGFHIGLGQLAAVRFTVPELLP